MLKNVRKNPTEQNEIIQQLDKKIINRHKKIQVEICKRMPYLTHATPK